MFIFISVCLAGGNVHIHFHEEKCYDEEIFFYHLGCHQWVSAKEKLSEYESEQNSRLLDCTLRVWFIFLAHYILFGLEMVVIRQPNKVHFVYVDEISTKCLYAPLWVYLYKPKGQSEDLGLKSVWDLSRLHKCTSLFLLLLFTSTFFIFTIFSFFLSG